MLVSVAVPADRRMPAIAYKTAPAHKNKAAIPAFKLFPTSALAEIASPALDRRLGAILKTSPSLASRPIETIT